MDINLKMYELKGSDSVSEGNWRAWYKNTGSISPAIGCFSGGLYSQNLCVAGGQFHVAGQNIHGIRIALEIATSIPGVMCVVTVYQPGASYPV